MKVLKFMSQYEYLKPGLFVFEDKVYLKIDDVSTPIRYLTEEDLEDLQYDEKDYINAV